MNMRKDIAISFMGHLSLMAIIIIVNPATGVLRGTPELMTIDLSGLSAPAAAAEQAVQPHEEEIEVDPIEPPEVPESISDEAIEESFAVASADTLETIIEEKEPEPEPEPEKPKPKPKPREKPPEPEVAAVEEESGPKEIEGSAGRGLEISSAVGEGEGVAGDSRGSGSFGLPYNISLLERKIERSWRNPVSSANQVTCTIYFQVGRDGQLIGQPVVEKSSGITTFDNEAVYAIMRVDQFPAFPTSFEYDFIGIHLDFAYVP